MAQFNSPTITSTSLILSIQAKDPHAWDRFAKLYTPFVYAELEPIENAVDSINHRVYVRIASN